MRNALWISGVTALIAFAPLTARAQDPVDVAIGGQKLFTLKSNDYGKTPKQRADGVYDRLRYIINGRVRASQVRMEPAGDNVSYRIKAKNRLVVLVGPGEAGANKTDTKTLAHDWTARLKKSLPIIAAQANAKGTTIRPPRRRTHR